MSDWPGILSALIAGRDLTRDDAAWAMSEVMTGEATPAQIAGFVVALRAKGETPDELGGVAAAMLQHGRPVTVDRRVVDTCGTGGDRSHTVNISTMAALVVAGCGVPVVKHGNRAASSSCGSADLLEALGVVIDLEPDAVATCAAEVGIAFCFAPVFHPALRHAAVPRRELGIATVFNFLGPLTNPARPAVQVIGVADTRMAGVMAGVLAQRGTSALLFRGDDGLDELTTTSTSRVWEVRDGAVTESVVDPAELGIPRATLDDLRGGDATINADVARALVAGEAGPVRDAVLLNAAAALVAYEAEGGGLTERLGAALQRAAAGLDGGGAATVLDRWVEVSGKLATTTA